MALSYIAGLPFIRLTPVTLQPRENIVSKTRPGNDSLTLHRIGKWSPPIQIQSLNAATTVFDGFQLHALYLSLIGSTVEIVWGSLYWHSVLNVRFVVLDVELTEMKRVINGVSSYGSFGAMMKCNWKMQPVVV